MPVRCRNGLLSASLEPSLPATVERGRSGRTGLRRRAGGLPRLRWPMGLHEAVETAGLLPVGGEGPSSSRVRFPATWSRWRRRRRRQGIRSSRALPRLGGALLRRRRRVRGGGVGLHRLMYRSLRRLVSRRLDAAVPATRFVKDAATASGVAAGRRVDRTRDILGALVDGKLRSMVGGARCASRPMFFQRRLQPVYGCP